VEQDLPALHAIMSDPQTMRYWSTPPHPDVETTRQWLSSMIEARSDLDFILELDGRCIGKVGCWRPPEFGYILARDCWGLGYASEALAAFIPYAFAGFTDHLIADVDPRNDASLALLARFGFRETHRAPKTWLVGGEWCDSVYLRLDRPWA
jgi:[ribosomal protein S5]-alanine N-acetyltransferase